MWLTVLVLAAVIAGGLLASSYTHGLSQRYLSASEEIQVLVEQGQWERAGEAAQSYAESWQQTSPYVQMLIDHTDVDAVTMALRIIGAGVKAKDEGMCYQACAELREHAHHLYHRDALTLSNVL